MLVPCLSARCARRPGPCHTTWAMLPAMLQNARGLRLGRPCHLCWPSKCAGAFWFRRAVQTSGTRQASRRFVLPKASVGMRAVQPQRSHRLTGRHGCHQLCLGGQSLGVAQSALSALATSHPGSPWQRLHAATTSTWHAWAAGQLNTGTARSAVVQLLSEEHLSACWQRQVGTACSLIIDRHGRFQMLLLPWHRARLVRADAQGGHLVVSDGWGEPRGMSRLFAL
mmetsp:Transcript_66370/g.213895  ORF Transcript_66370/g.213895 Transcript_66370/m.213895 type:complete len:225 (+) Transcript_66370:857-1531(+)